MRFARASLKQNGAGGRGIRREPLSRAFCAGLIEAQIIHSTLLELVGLSRAFCAGLIEAIWSLCFQRDRASGYPVRFARASLKPLRRFPRRLSRRSYPVRFARASLKRGAITASHTTLFRVIPCVLRGPH